MPLVVANWYVKRVNPTNAPAVILLEDAWKQVKPLLLDPSLENGAKAVMASWYNERQRREYAGWNELVTAIRSELSVKRANYFWAQPGENLNIAPVIYRTDVPTSSIGWTETEFFEQLGDRSHPCFPEEWSSRQLASFMSDDFFEGGFIAKQAAAGLKRRAEQEYLLQNMVKGGLWEAAQVADEIKVGIAVRPTGLAAHMGIESGDPTKAQEFKNKTSKEEDVILCEELDWTQLGSVVHYDPRVEWSSQAAQQHADLGKSPMFAAAATANDWKKKEVKIKLRLDKFPRIKEKKDLKLEKVFYDRSKEYMEEDHHYRKGHYAPYTTLVGPYIRLKVRPEVNMVGDHDLFAFTDPEKYGIFMQESDPRVARAQKALQNKPTFQAQHGGIWYWRPTQKFNFGIKQGIMTKHGPKDKEPLVYIRPNYEVTAAYYTDDDNLKSVWADKSWTKWMESTHSGKLFLNPTRDPNEW